MEARCGEPCNLAWYPPVQVGRWRCSSGQGKIKESKWPILPRLAYLHLCLSSLLGFSCIFTVRLPPAKNALVSNAVIHLVFQRVGCGTKRLHFL